MLTGLAAATYGFLAAKNLFRGKRRRIKVAAAMTWRAEMTTRKQRIEEIAYHLWEQEGRPDGHSERLYFAAEAQYEADLAKERYGAEVAEGRAEPAAKKPARSEKTKPAEAAATLPARPAAAKAAAPAAEMKPAGPAVGKKSPAAKAKAPEPADKKPQEEAKRKPKGT